LVFLSSVRSLLHGLGEVVEEAMAEEAMEGEAGTVVVDPPTGDIPLTPIVDPAIPVFLHS